MDIVKSYDAHLDSKRRITLRGAQYQNYNVNFLKNGCIVLEPRVLVAPPSISAKTLKMIDDSVANLKLSRVSDPVDLSDF